MASLKDLIVRGPARFLDKLYGNLEGNASSASWLNANSSLTYGANGFQYFNLSGTQGTSPSSNNTPTSDWYHIMRLNHANSSGCFADIAVPLNDTAGIWWRQIRYGTNYGWYKILDSNNYTNYTVTKTGGGASGTWGINISGNASTASALTSITTTDKADGTNDWRRVWFSYNDNTTGRPAYDDRFVFQTSTGTLKAPVFSGNWNGNTIGIGYGGTGVTSLNDLRKLFREWAPINSSNDTTSNWGVKGLSVAGYGDGNTLTDKPSNWGIVLNMNASDTEVHQLWFTQASGRIFHRGGNSSGWNGSWRLMYSDGDSIIYSSSEPTDRVKGTIWLKPA